MHLETLYNINQKSYKYPFTFTKEIWYTRKSNENAAILSTTVLDNVLEKYLRISKRKQETFL